MVAGKDTSRHLAKAVAPPKLPPLPKLRVRKPDSTTQNPCLAVMSTVLGTRTLPKDLVYMTGGVETYRIIQSYNTNVIQVAGHLQAIPDKVALFLSSNCAHVWTER